ncbi:MAG TPA: M48 family metalloprotease [Thermoleophilaceae bacterium]|nr:M48 family metalloprotease [Thermoleophilaceae bacterium]
MVRHRSGLPIAVLATVAAAGLATLILRPRSGLIDPQAVEASAYFTAEQIERAVEFRDPQRILGLAGLALSAGTLALVALRPPAVVRRALDRAAARPYAGAAAVGAGLSAGLVLVTLPLDAVRHERAVDVGLSVQDWVPWLGDLAKSAAIGALFAAGGAVLAIALVRRFPRRWWIPGSGLLVGVASAFVLLSPLVIDPLFNDFDELPEGRLRADVVALAERAGVDVGEVLRVDASRRTTGVNAYVGGLGHTKRVVLYDNLLERFPPEQVRSVVAHELAHVKHRDVPRGLLWLAIVAPAGVLLVQRLTERIAPGMRDARSLPALALSLALVSFAVGSAGNVLSRQVEARADAFALRLTGDPAAFIAFEREIAVSNISDPEPPALLHALFGTHPTAVERIGYGLRFAAGER